MLSLLTAEQMKICDHAAATPPISSCELMERAARAATDLFIKRSDLFPSQSVLVLCHGGNNGGDGMAMARFLHEHGIQVTVGYAGKTENSTPVPSGMTPETYYQYGKLLDCGITPLTELSLDGFTSIVDALFGIGLSRPIAGKSAEWIRAIESKKIPVLALDIPSGVLADSGEVLPPAIHAKMTCTFGQIKPGLYLYPGADYCGKVVLCPIGIPYISEAGPIQYTILEDKDVKTLLPQRPTRSNKGTFGRVLSICGTQGMCGAAILSGKAAYRTGAGLVEIATHESNRVIMQTSLPEALLTTYDDLTTTLPTRSYSSASAILIGCGLGQSETSLQLLRNTLSSITEQPLLMDADALNLLSSHPDLWNSVPKNTIITPHMAEMARLSNKSIQDIVQSPLQYAQELSIKHHIICVMKDANTIVVAPDGQITINTTGNSGLATGGSGDVLAGTIASLLAQGLPAFDAARVGVYLHGMAGDRISTIFGQHGLMSGDLPDAIALILKSLES